MIEEVLEEEGEGKKWLNRLKLFRETRGRRRGDLGGEEKQREGRGE